MESHGGLAVKVRTEFRETALRPSGAWLRELVGRIGEEGDRWIVVQRVPDLPDVFAQVWHRAGETYRFEYRVSRTEFYGTEAADAAAVAEALVAWAVGAPGWEAGFVWTPVDVDPPEAARELPEEIRVRVEGVVRLMLVCGYEGRGALAEAAEQHLREGDARPVSPVQARELVDRMWVERVVEQEAWEGVTDPERVAAAFERLREAGIVARENFACCRSCGDAEIGAEAGEGDRGFVYFHSQCTEGAAQGGGLMLLYGAFDEGADAARDVGREVVRAVEGAGLSTEWDEDPGWGIAVTPLDWRKRLVG